MATRLRLGDSPTGKTTEGCYAAELKDCDGGALTAEHYISRDVLEQIGKVVTFQGLPWAEGPKNIGVGAATAKVLCARHNNALGPLDSAAGQFFKCLVEFHAGTLEGAQSFDGEDIERWMIKVLCGLTASGNLGRHDKKRVSEAPPQPWLEFLFWDRPLDEDRGLYFFEPPADAPGLFSNVVTLIPKSYDEGHAEAGKLFGLSAVLLGVGLCTTFCTALPAGAGRQVHRPDGFDLDKGRIDFKWSSKHSGTRIAASKAPPGGVGAGG